MPSIIHEGLTNDSEVYKDSSFDNALINLQSFFLVRAEETYGHFSLHPMTHLWIQQRMSKSDRIALLKKAFQIFLNTRLNNPSQFNESSLSYHLDYLLENFQTSLLETPPNFKMITVPPGKTALQRNKITASILTMYIWLDSLVRDLSASIRGRFLRPGDQALTWQILYDLRYVYRNQGFYDKEEALNHLALIHAWQDLPRLHPLSLPVVGDLAYSILRQQRLSEAMDWYQWVLWARTLVLGKGHPATTGAVNGIGLVLESQGRFEEALASFVDAYTGRQRRLGPFDKMSGTVLGNIVRVVAKMKHIDSGYWREKQFEFIAEQPSTSAIRRFVAGMETIMAWAQQANCDKVMNWTNTTLSIWYDTTSGLIAVEDIARLADVTDDGAWVCRQSGNFDGALSIYKQILSLLELSCNFTAEHIPTEKVVKFGVIFSQLFHRLGSTYLDQNMYDDSLSWNLRAFKLEERFSKSLPRPSPGWTVRLYDQISQAQREIGLFRDALEMDARSQILQEHVCTHEHWSCKEEWDPRLKYATIAVDLAQLERVKEAAEIWHKNLNWVAFKYGQCSNNMIAFLNNLANAYCRLGEYDRSREYFRQAMSCRIHELGFENQEVYGYLYQLGKTDIWAGEYEDGLALIDYVGGKDEDFVASGGGTLHPEWKSLIELLYDRQLHDDARRWTRWLIKWAPQLVRDCDEWAQEMQLSWTMSDEDKERFSAMCREAKTVIESTESKAV